MVTRTKTTLVVLALTLLLLSAALAAWFLVLEPAEEGDDLAGVADALEPLVGRVRNVAALVNPIMNERAAAVAASLQSQVPAETPDRAGFIGSCLAVWANESRFYPNIFNYYDDAKKLRVGYYPDNANWTRAHAVGIAQMVYLKDAGLTIETAFDLDRNVEASLRRLNLPAWSKIMAGCPDADLQTRCAILYMGHGRGPATVPTAVSVIAGGGSWDEVSAAVTSRWGTGGLRFAHMWSVAANAQSYADKFGSAA